MASIHFGFRECDLVDAAIPFMGESISDGILATFLKQPGDKVDVDEPIAQVETDKVTIDVASPEAGVIQKLVMNEGDTVEPGTKIATGFISVFWSFGYIRLAEKLKRTANNPV